MPQILDNINDGLLPALRKTLEVAIAPTSASATSTCAAGVRSTIWWHRGPETPDDVERRAAIAQRRAAEEAAARQLLEGQVAALEASLGGGDQS